MSKIDKPRRAKRLNAKGLTFGIVVSTYNSIVTESLLRGALGEIERNGGQKDKQKIVRVPGGFEIPLAAKWLLEAGGIDGVITLGCIMKGETTHNEYIAAEVTRGIGSLALEYQLPVAFGVLTPNTAEQALARSGPGEGNKGAEAARAAIEMALLKRSLK
ncbi:MAG TPA: 6,7-dimethyl-8-ribityllumazine synthase [Candidatus Sumerlaeota bacterium]|nr:6,7-dimethyl-8-ribityllumazine synthase [Candidatus Sumerlaeota bacterium]HMX63129.1 6,7-dimethyl-8-ribityllumazine synthase [Candidatus Sumerlaeota bacterium]HMZ50844.1 6,7-dimethyl-8-ribityllumazine synthase [Candidatus Sumerlaeota bacterium]HNM47178.1 6,7-dimethyl-8-ribityllumazine synthase [Candidatus Sumerlaeota bacterium]